MRGWWMGRPNDEVVRTGGRANGKPGEVVEYGTLRPQHKQKRKSPSNSYESDGPYRGLSSTSLKLTKATTSLS
jgi:hypothetical protein